MLETKPDQSRGVRRRLELLAPAKTAAIGRDAIDHGADAVYIGGPAFGARAGACNSMTDIAALVDYAQRYHARVYVALNTILRDDELEPAQRLVRDCWDAGVDALIIQDMGLLELDLPPLALHASTQCDIRSPAKARFLADVGFSQLVLARELTLAEVAEVRAAVPETTALEHFVHGALCVAYSGQCYISHAQTGRSANRGDCSQACRLPYTLEDSRGRIVAFDQHLLSLKDNDQSANLEALIAAGVDSFKIEGRYKEADYVKNITGHYRLLLDRIMEGRPELAPSSSGRTQILFTPDPGKTFHRGSTDYFSHGRRDDIGAFAAPGHVGEELGVVTQVDGTCFELEATAPLANGDGLTWLAQREVVGVYANRAEAIGDGLWRVWPAQPIALLPGLRRGTIIRRNRDRAWERTLAKKSAERRVAVRAVFSANDGGYTLALADSDGISGLASVSFEFRAAQDPAAEETRLRAQLARLGDSEFVLQDLDIRWEHPGFLPDSLAKALRREAAVQLSIARRSAYARPQRLAAAEPAARYPQTSLSYLANVFNARARAFYARHGVEIIAPAYESHQEAGAVSLMITRHCLRHAMSLCPKQAKGVTGVQGEVRAEPMVLVNGEERLTLEFDCQACEMHVVGSMRPQILRQVSALANLPKAG